jgi:hypothetical protein
MIRKDFIQRHFDELAKVLAAVLQLKNDFKPVEAESKINDFANDFLGIHFEELFALEEHLIPHLKEQKAFTLAHFKILEDLLYHKHRLQPNDNPLKAITEKVLNYVALTDTDYSLERMNRLKELS